MLRGVWSAQVIDVHPNEFEVSIIMPHLLSFEGIRVAIGGQRRHPLGGDYQMPEAGDWGLVVFATNDPRSGAWLTALSDRYRHLIPLELLAADPLAALTHHRGGQYAIEHGDGSTEAIWPDGTLVRLTTTKDGAMSNPSGRSRRTPRKRTVNARLGTPGERRDYVPPASPPVDVRVEHSSGATITLTADGSFLLVTPRGHRLRLHDATEKARNAEGAVTATPEEDAQRVASEVVISSEVGHQIRLRDDPNLALVDRSITVVSSLGHRVTMQDMPADDQHLTVRSNAGHRVELRDTPVAVATVATPGGRQIVLDDANARSTITDPVVINVNAPRVNIAGNARRMARLGDTVQVTITGGSSAGTWNGTITGASGTVFTG